MIKFRRLNFRKILCLILTYYCVEILWRRWFFGQIPTQVSPLFTYGLVILDFATIFILLRPKRFNHL